MLLLASGVVVLSVNVRAKGEASRRARPLRFERTNNGFGVAPLVSPGLVAIPPMMAAGFSLSTLLTLWRDFHDPDPAVSTLISVFGVVMTTLVTTTILVTVASVVAAWRGFAIELTPAGVCLSGPLFRRSVPWEALAPGGPPRPHMTADRLRLDVARPELVVQRGWALGFGPRQRPVMALQVDVHPWFLADAIRWYAEHPADRGAIGTESEHQRLVAELTSAPSDIN
jgi:hypothetical protein